MRVRVGHLYFLIMRRPYYLEPENDPFDWGLSVTGAGRNACGPRRRTDAALCYWPRMGRRVLNDYAFVYVASGRGFFTSDELPESVCEPGDMLMAFPGAWHTYGPDPAVGWEELWITFNGSKTARLADEGVFSPKAPLLKNVARLGVAEYFVRVFEEARERRAGFTDTIATQTMCLLARLRAAHRKAGVEPRIEDILMSARRVLEANPFGEIDFAALAGAAGYSYSHFRRLFGKLMGCAPHQYVLSLRIDQARQLLADGNPVGRVARLTGFENVHYFSRLFKEKTGVPPSKWRGM